MLGVAEKRRADKVSYAALEPVPPEHAMKMRCRHLDWNGGNLATLGMFGKSLMVMPESVIAELEVVSFQQALYRQIGQTLHPLRPLRTPSAPSAILRPLHALR